MHTIVLTVIFPDGTKHKYLRKQRVDSATNILRGEFNPAANDFDPTPIQTLESSKKYLAVLKKIAADKPPATEQDKEKHETTIKNLDAYIFHLDDHLKGLEHKEAYQVDAIHIDVERSTRTTLKLWLINTTKRNSDEITWRLIDWTNPAHRSTTGSYEESGDTHQEAIENLLETWDDNNRYPEGRIRYKFKVSKYKIDEEDGFDTDGMSTWDEISKWLDYVALGAAVVAGVATLIAPVPGSRVVSAAIWASIVTSTGAATINIAQRHDEGFGNLKDDAFDGLSIVGNLFAGAGTYWKVGASVTSATRLGSGMSKAIIIGQIGTDGLQGVMLAAEHIGQYNQIMDDPNLLPEDRLKKLMELFRSAAISGAMTYIAVKGSTADLDNLNNNRTLLKAVEVELPTTNIDLDLPIEHSVPVKETQTKVKTKTEIEPETRQLDETVRSIGPFRGSIDDFKVKLESFVKTKTNEIIASNDGIAAKKAVAAAGAKELPFPTKTHFNIEGRKAWSTHRKTKVGLLYKTIEGASSDIIEVKDINKHLNHLEETYLSKGYTLDPKTEELVRDYLENNIRFPANAGPPGMHAEVLAVNELFIQMRNSGISITTENLATIKVATHKVQSSNGRQFVACVNCSGILKYPIDIFTGHQR